MRFAAPALALMFALFSCEPSSADGRSVIKKAEISVRAGSASARGDVDALYATLRASRDSFEQTKLIEAIGTLGDAEGTTPAEMKAYIKSTAPAVLLEIARTRTDWAVRGEALMGLRRLDASDSAIEEAIGIALADHSREAAFLRSRAELLRSWKESRGEGQSAAGVAKLENPTAEGPALKLLRAKGMGVSYDSLQRAIASGDVVLVDALLNAGVSVKGGDGQRAAQMLINGMSTACENQGIADFGLLGALDRLGVAGFDFKYADALDNTLVMSAAQFCPPKVAEKMIALGAEVDRVNKQSFTPLKMALVSNHWEVAAVLVEHGAKLNAADVGTLFVETPREPKKRALLAKASGVELPAIAPSEAARPAAQVEPAATHTAPRLSRKEALRYLQQVGIDALPDNLATLILSGDIPAVEAMIAAGVDVNARASLPQSTLQLAAMSCTGGSTPDASAHLIDVLVGAGAKVEAPGVGGLGALMIAAQQCRAAPIRRLLAAGASLEQRTPQGFTPLSMALTVKNYEAAETLIDAGARISTVAAAKFAGGAPDARLDALVTKATK